MTSARPANGRACSAVAGPIFPSRGTQNGANFFPGTRSAPAQISSSVATRPALLVASLVTEGRKKSVLCNSILLSVCAEFIRPLWLLSGLTQIPSCPAWPGFLTHLGRRPWSAHPRLARLLPTRQPCLRQTKGCRGCELVRLLAVRRQRCDTKI